jgi:hypothetical protein
MQRKWDHQTIDRANEAADHFIARRLRRDPRLFQTARRNLQRWMAKEGKEISACFLEWADILNSLTRAEVADFLASDTPKARRLRQSSPFMGLLTRREADYIDRKFYETGRH